MANANYIWIGKPPTGEHGGQDTLGPKIMRERMPEQSITFWCLKSQQAHYQAVYDGLNIEVLAIEDAILPKDQAILDFIQLCLKRVEFLEQKLANAIATGDNTLQKAVKKDIAREYISIKDIMIYYLQIEHQLVNHSDEECRYYLDTNITLQPDFDKPRLEDLSTFSAPYYPSEYDPWLMISTKKEMDSARRRFDKVFEEYYVRVYQKYGLQEPVNDTMALHTLDTRLWLGTSYIRNCSDADKMMMNLTASGAGNHVYLDIGLQKFYMNTHTPSVVCDQEPLLARLAKGTSAIYELKHFLRESSFKPKDIYTATIMTTECEIEEAKINIFLDLCFQPEDTSQELEVLIDALDDLSILFFNDIEIYYGQAAPFIFFIDRYEEQSTRKELVVLFEKCFERYPELKVRCFKLLERFIPSDSAPNIEQLIDQLVTHELALIIVLYTFQSIIPEGEHRVIPDFVIEFSQKLQTVPVTAPIDGFFAAVDKGAPPPTAPEEESDKDHKPS